MTPFRRFHIDDLPPSEDLGREAGRLSFRQDHRQSIGGLFG